MVTKVRHTGKCECMMNEHQGSHLFIFASMYNIACLLYLSRAPFFFLLSALSPFEDRVVTIQCSKKINDLYIEESSVHGLRL